MDIISYIELWLVLLSFLTYLYTFSSDLWLLIGGFDEKSTFIYQKFQYLDGIWISFYQVIGLLL